MNLAIKKILTTFNFSDKNDVRRIKYLVIHYFGSLGTAQSVAKYFASAYRGASVHYSLDNGSTIYQSVEDEDIAWHCGTSGTYFHAECRNSNSIGIEVRPYKIDESRVGYASDTDWYFTEETISNLVVFVKYLMEKYGIDADHVVRHYDVTHKLCPRPYVGDDVNDYHLVSGNDMWERFKTRLTAEESEDEDMDAPKFKELYLEMRKELQDNDDSSYSEEARNWAISNGLIKGGDPLSDGTPNYMWEDIPSREQLITLFYRFAVLIGKA